VLRANFEEGGVRRFVVPLFVEVNLVIGICLGKFRILERLGFQADQRDATCFRLSICFAVFASILFANALDVDCLQVLSGLCSLVAALLVLQECLTTTAQRLHSFWVTDAANRHVMVHVLLCVIRVQVNSDL